MDAPGMDNLKKVVKFGLDLGEAIANAATQASALGKVSAMLHLVEDAPELMSVNWGNLNTEFQGLTPEEMDLLKEFVNENFDIADDQLEAKIKASVEVVVDLGKVFQGAFKIWHHN